MRASGLDQCFKALADHMTMQTMKAETRPGILLFFFFSFSAEDAFRMLG
jgi:hypothetical protein